MESWRRGALAAVLSLWIGAPAYAGPARADALRRSVIEALETRDDPRAATLIAKLLEHQPDNGAMAYNGACVHCRLGDLEQAEAYLRQAVRSGYLRFSHMRRDPEIDPLRSGSVYRAVMAAREAADALLAERRIADATSRFGGDCSVLRRDEARLLDYLGVYDDASWARLRDRVGGQADHLVERLFDRHLDLRTLIVISVASDAEDAFGDRHVHGVYQHGQRLLVTRDTGRALRHELVHVYHHHHMDLLGQQHPMWIQEGLACLYESHRLEDDGTPTFHPNGRDVIVERRRQDLMPWTTLMTLDDDEFNREPALRYAQARSILRFLADRGVLETWYRDYVDRYDLDPSGASSIAAALDAPLGDVERKWRRWLETQRVVVQEDDDPVPLQAPAPAPESVEPLATTPSAADLAYADARAARVAGDHAAAAAALERVIELDPEHTDARYDLALACVRADDLSGARRQHEELLRLDPSLASLVRNLLD